MINIPSYNTDPSYRYKMPRLQTKIEGRGNGIKTNLVNISDVARSLKCPTAYPTKFFGCEIGAQSKFEEATDRAIVNGAFEQGFMQDLLDKFIDKYILCPKCKLPELTMATSNRFVVAKCKACGWAGDLDNSHKLANFIVNNPPPETKHAMQTSKAKEESSDSEAAKKPKKEKKEKKEKKSKKEESPVDIGKLTISKDLAILVSEVIQPLSAQHAKAAFSDDQIFAELRKREIALQFDIPSRLFCGLSILFPNGLTAKNFPAKTLKAIVPNKCLDTAGICEVFELYYAKNPTVSTKDYPMILKALYDQDVLSEGSLIRRYSSSLETEGFAEAKKRAKPFIEWLKTEDSEDDEPAPKVADLDVAGI